VINWRWSISVLVLAMVALVLPACGGAATPTPLPPTPTATPTSVPTPEPTAAPTATPTPPGGGTVATPEPPTTLCDGLGGDIEVRVLVGPAEVVGLEPLAVGSIPFAVSTGAEPYVLQGGGAISYADVLVEEWGTYEVTLDLQMSISGECVAGATGEELRVTLSMAGQQMVEVEADRFQGEYPWAGEVSFDLTFPIVEGATVEGEGWAFVLHPHGG
jgi:hypothetical protein